MSREAINELKRIRSILSGTFGLEDDDQEYIEDARKSVDRIIESLAEQPAQQEPVADEVRCPECGYLTKHTEHIGCLRKQLNAINAFEQRNFAIVNMDKFPPAQRTWVGLTDEEVDEWTPEIHSVIRAIEDKLKEKNT